MTRLRAARQIANVLDHSIGSQNDPQWTRLNDDQNDYAVFRWYRDPEKRSSTAEVSVSIYGRRSYNTRRTNTVRLEAYDPATGQRRTRVYRRLNTGSYNFGKIMKAFHEVVKIHCFSLVAREREKKQQHGNCDAIRSTLPEGWLVKPMQVRSRFELRKEHYPLIIRLTYLRGGRVDDVSVSFTNRFGHKVFSAGQLKELVTFVDLL